MSFDAASKLAARAQEMAEHDGPLADDSASLSRAAALCRVATELANSRGAVCAAVEKKQGALAKAEMDAAERARKAEQRAAEREAAERARLDVAEQRAAATEAAAQAREDAADQARIHRSVQAAMRCTSSCNGRNPYDPGSEDWNAYFGQCSMDCCQHYGVAIGDLQGDFVHQVNGF